MADLISSLESVFSGQLPEDGSGATLDDSIGDARVRAYGIDPATNQFLSPVYQQAWQSTHSGTVDDFVSQLRAATDAQFQADYAANSAALAQLNQQSGGFFADLINPFSANIDPNSATAKTLAGIPWRTILVLVIAITVVAGIHEVKTI
jgi:hypothetical protein